MNTPKPLIVDQAVLDWECSRDAAVASRSAIRWKLLISGERTQSRGIVTGIALLPPGAQLLAHHHEPEETYYVVSGQGEMEIDDETTAVGPGCAIYIPAHARHALRCTGSDPLLFVFSFARGLRLRGDSSIDTGMEWAPERERSSDAEVSFSWRRVLRGVRGGCPVTHAVARAEHGVRR